MDCDIGQVLKEHYKGCAFSLRGNEYSTLKWNERNTVPKPTLEDIQSKWDDALIKKIGLKSLRRERDRRLAEVDWIFSGDYQLSEEEWGAWTTYRQALRDLPSTTEDPANPVWPEKPPLPKGNTQKVNLFDTVISGKSQITLLQNVVHDLTKRIEALENA